MIDRRKLASGIFVIPPPETVRTPSSRVACDGATDIAPSLGHPRVWLEIDEKGYADCGYCDRRFVLIGGPADQEGDSGAAQAA